MSGGMKFKTRLAGGAAFAALMLGSAAAAAAEPVKFDIAPQSLTAALNEFGVQSNHAVLFTTDLTGAKVTHGVSKEADPEIALAEMLDGTGLSFRRSGDAFLIVSASDPQSGSAAGDGADAGTVQALIVTAQKREENIQDVPIAMSAFTQEALERSQVAGGPDLMTQVPNMTFTKTNFSSYSIQLRGIGTQAISATTDPAVAVAFNNTPFIRNRFFEQEFYDLQRVEVLRGPQGTLYGRNATAGVVNIISQKPKFVYEAKLLGDVSNYKSTRLEGMVNIPLVEDLVALRLAGAWTKRDGYVTNEITGNPIDGRDLWSTRVSLRVAPSDALDINLIWEHFQEDDDRLRSGKQLCKKDLVTEVAGIPIPPDDNDNIGGKQSAFSQGCKPASLYSPDSFQTPNGWALPYYHPLIAIGLPGVPFLDPYKSGTQSQDLRVIESTVDPKYRAKSDLLEVQAKWDISDALTLASETSYGRDFIFSTQDFNRFNTTEGAWNRPSVFPNIMDGRRQELLTPSDHDTWVFCDPQLGCADRLVGVDLSTAKSTQFSQELRLSSDFDGPFNFSLGANFLRYDTEDKYYVFFNSLTMIAAISTFWDFPSGNTSLAPWRPGVSTNAECLVNGPIPPGTTALSVSGCNYIDPNPISNLNDQGHNYFLSRNPYKLISYAVFGEAYYKITEALKVTAGLRWTVDKKEAPRIPSWVLAADTVGYPTRDVVHQEWREPTGRLAVDWKPDLSFTDESLLYFSYAHGYKAGGANPPPAGVVMYCADCLPDLGQKATSKSHPKTFDAEFVDAFELGSKNTLLDGKVTANLAAFYYDYTDYQISYIVNRSAVNLNFDARVWGVELEADWRPLENLRLGLKTGYEDTRVADGENAVDVMDRANGGLPDEHGVRWVVLKPFPTFPSNCIVPEYVVTPNGSLVVPGNIGGGTDSGCELAYILGVDPVTRQPYVADPHYGLYPDYPGFNPATAPNNGEGFSKDLSGHELPNAPHMTATITADYTVPLPSNWLMTLHTDLYYQSEAWTRIFNMPGYDKLKAYNNINLAAIFTNDDAGWKVMAYVKNVLDRDSITGAFLNSDDTGLTTNVFLTEPRLYGLRVTKEFTGGSLLGSFGSRHEGPYPLTVELGGGAQRDDAPGDTFLASSGDAFSSVIDPRPDQIQDLDWGDGRSVKVTYRPNGFWNVSLGARFGKANTGMRNYRTQDTERVCYASQAICDYQAELLGPGPRLDHKYASPDNWSESITRRKEEHTLVDFAVGRDFGLGGMSSTLSAGLRYAKIKSALSQSVDGVPDWELPPEYWVFIPATHDRVRFDLAAEREFEGLGPVVSWEASKRLMGGEDKGRLEADWSISGGVLFGRQKSSIDWSEEVSHYSDKYFFNPQAQSAPPDTDTAALRRSDRKTAPVLGASLGLSYKVDRFSLGAGYQWERYFDVLDTGYAEHQDADRTIDGPYFKIAVGFGG